MDDIPKLIAGAFNKYNGPITSKHMMMRCLGTDLPTEPERKRRWYGIYPMFCKVLTIFRSLTLVAKIGMLNKRTNLYALNPAHTLKDLN